MDETTQMTAEEEAALAELREKHGEDRIESWYVEGYGLVVAAAPSKSEEFDRLLNGLSNDKEGADRSGPLRTFALACVIYPKDIDAARKILKAHGNFYSEIAAAGQRLAKVGVTKLGKK